MLKGIAIRLSCRGLKINRFSTQGDAANADNKPRPDRILPWPEFDVEQAHTWDDLMGSEFVLERHCTSYNVRELQPKIVPKRMLIYRRLYPRVHQETGQKIS